MSKVPLYIVTGAHASGKTSVVKELRRIMPDYDVFDFDDLRKFFKEDSGKVDKHKIRNIWLRVARDIAESGRITIICGVIKPQEIERCNDYDYFSHIHYLLLHCDDKTRENRLRARKRMPEFQYVKKLAKWFIENADQHKPPIPIVDTSQTDVTKVAEQIREWIQDTRSRIDNK